MTRTVHLVTWLAAANAVVIALTLAFAEASAGAPSAVLGDHVRTFAAWCGIG